MYDPILDHTCRKEDEDSRGITMMAGIGFSGTSLYCDHLTGVLDMDGSQASTKEGITRPGVSPGILMTVTHDTHCPRQLSGCHLE